MNGYIEAHYIKQEKIDADVKAFLKNGGTIKRHKINKVPDIKADFVPKYKDLAQDKAVEICMRLKDRGLNNLTIAKKMGCSTREVNKLMRLGGRRDKL